nr:IQ domain-containing protein F2-like [Peromyscus maniculatus bairdii]
MMVQAILGLLESDEQQPTGDDHLSPSSAMGAQCCKSDVELSLYKEERQPKSKSSLISSVTEEEDEIVQRKEKRKAKKQKKFKKAKIKAAIKVQAWWRGTLVRRTLLHAALRAWIIQCWWRLTLGRNLEKKRRKALIDYSNRERAVVKLQSLIRMWRIHWRYCQVLNAICIIQGHWKYHNCQSCSLLRGHCVITTTHLQFHIEIIDH